MYCLVAGKVIPKPLEGYLDLDFLRPNGSAYRSSILVKLIVTKYPPPPALQHAHLCDWEKKKKKVKVKRSYFTLVTQNSHVTNKPGADGALILPPSHHQCSVLQAFKSYLKQHGKEGSQKKNLRSHQAIELGTSYNEGRAITDCADPFKRN